MDNYGFDHHPLKFSLEDRAQITPARIENFYHGSGMAERLLKKAHLSCASRD